MTTVCELSANDDRIRPVLGGGVLCDWLATLGIDPDLCLSFRVLANGDGAVVATMYQVDGRRRRIPNAAGTDMLTETRPRHVVNEAHVMPTGDLVEHEISQDCTCGPSLEFVTGGKVVTHHSLDGRERNE